MKKLLTLIATASFLAACSGSDGAIGPPGSTGNDGQIGPQGPPGAGYLPLESAGVTGYVTDVSNAPVAGAKVYFVPQAEVAALAATTLNIDPTSDTTQMAARANATNDEPLEDLIETAGSTYVSAVTNEDGVYRVPTLPTGNPVPEYFIVAVPSDANHLPGGTHCRAPLAADDLIGRQVNMQVSSKAGADAFYVGASVCYTCHGRQHEKYSLHMNGIRVLGKSGPLQKADKYNPRWNEALAKFSAGDETAGGTTLYFVPNGVASTANDWKVSETDPVSGVVLTARLYSVTTVNPDASETIKYYVQLKDFAASPTTATYEAQFSYGGGLYKQRLRHDDRREPVHHPHPVQLRLRPGGRQRDRRVGGSLLTVEVAALQPDLEPVVHRLHRCSQGSGQVEGLRQQLRRLPLHRVRAHGRRDHRVEGPRRAGRERRGRLRR